MSDDIVTWMEKRVKENELTLVTRRDRFAMAIMTGLEASPGTFKWSREKRVKYAWETADAMEEAREGK